MNILIVEDDPIIGADLEDRLMEMGYQVLGPVAAGELAMEYFKKDNLPDLVIMDIQLEGEWDGIETTRRIREKHTTPVIFLTSNSDDVTFDKAKAVNPQAFLSKPFRGRDLKHAIELAIRQSANDYAPLDQNPPEENTYLLRDCLFIKVQERMVRLFFKDILWVEADNYYCKIVTSEKEYLLSQTLKKFNEMLDGMPDWMRVHRSYMVNLRHIGEIGEIHLHIHGRKIPLSKTSREELLARLYKV